MLSVLVVNWNTRDLLRACLASLARHAPKNPWEVIVVDNASSDGSAEMVKSEFPWVNLVESGSNTGYARGNNIAFNAARGDYLLTLNPDTEFEDDTLQRALATLTAKSDYGVLGIRLVGPDGETQKSVRGFPTILGVFGELTGLSKRYSGGPLGAWTLADFDYGQPGPAPQPMGTFLLFRRDALEAVGDARAPFDEAFPIYFNEVDLLVRLRDAGWPCWYDPDLHVRHWHGASTRQVRKSMIWESHRSLVRYLRKHTRGAGRVLLPLVAAAAWIGAFVRARGYHAGFRPQHHDL